MSSYTAIIKCKECGSILSEITAYHEPKPDTFVPQDIVEEEFGLPAMYCHKCLNQQIRVGGVNNECDHK